MQWPTTYLPIAAPRLHSSQWQPQQLRSRRRHRAGTETAHRRDVTAPCEASTDRRERARDRLRCPAFAREERSDERGSRRTGSGVAETVQ